MSDLFIHSVAENFANLTYDHLNFFPSPQEKLQQQLQRAGFVYFVVNVCTASQLSVETLKEMTFHMERITSKIVTSNMKNSTRESVFIGILIHGRRVCC